MSRKQIASCSELHNLPNYSATLFTTDMFIRSTIISQEGPEWNLMMSYHMYVCEHLYECFTVQMTEHFCRKAQKQQAFRLFYIVIFLSYEAIL